MYGVINGIQYCNSNRVEELNERIYDRNIPSSTLQSQYGIRPVSTKYAFMPILDRRRIPSVPIKREPTFNIGQTFNPGNAQAPWSGFATNVNDESTLRNQFFALQSSPQSVYIPSTTSDMYNMNILVRPEIQQPYPDLFSSPTLEPFNPNSCGIATNIFDNCTRQQIKNVGMN